jgi:protein transport protein SEC24
MRKRRSFTKQVKLTVKLLNLERNPKDYKINPSAIPRPNQYDEIYRNSEKHYIYNTNEDSNPPLSTSYYVVNETQNSNPRFIRTSMMKIPTDQSNLSNSTLPFGLYCQPFAELDEAEREVPKVESKEMLT